MKCYERSTVETRDEEAFATSDKKKQTNILNNDYNIPLVKICEIVQKDTKNCIPHF